LLQLFFGQHVARHVERARRHDTRMTFNECI